MLTTHADFCFLTNCRKKPYAINEKSPNFERGEFHVIQRLVSYLPKGLQVKQEVSISTGQNNADLLAFALPRHHLELHKVIDWQVDAVIDMCGELINFRSITANTKHNLESIQEDYLIEVSLQV